MFKMALSQMDFTLKSDDLTFFIIVLQLPLITFNNLSILIFESFKYKRSWVTLNFATDARKFQ